MALLRVMPISKSTLLALGMTWLSARAPGLAQTAAPGRFDAHKANTAVTATWPSTPPVTDAILNISGTYPHLAVFSPDGEVGIGAVALWLGNVDDLWRLGAPCGVGGPWKDSAVGSGIPSDPYLMFGYDRKALALSHTSPSPITFTVEVDFAADNTWSEYASFTVPPGQTVRHVFPDGYSAHWVRLKSGQTTTATATFTYSPASH